MTLGAAGTIKRLERDMAFAALEYELNEKYRKRIDAEEFAVAAFWEALAKGLVTRPKPRAEWLDWPTDRSPA